MTFTTFITGFVAPIFIIVSPITSYADQTHAIYKSKSSAGFSLDIPLIMLVSSTLRVFYYPGARFDFSLLIQAFIMIAIQLVLLKVALDNRPSPSNKGGELALPFAASREGDLGVQRPHKFWQWRSPKPYWQFLLYLFITLVACELVLAPLPTIYSVYSSTIGYTGLAIEAMLPIPQMIANSRSRSCKGFRISVLVSWLAGDFMKMFWFFNTTTEIPLGFKICGIFQACCDSFLGIQYFMYGSGEPAVIRHTASLRPTGQLSRVSSALFTPAKEKEGRLE